MAIPVTHRRKSFLRPRHKASRSSWACGEWRQIGLLDNSRRLTALVIRPDGGAYEKEKQPIVDADPTQYGDTLYGITVGSEGIYRGTYSTDDLLGWISDMQSTFPSATIGTADSWNGWANGTMDNVIQSGIKLM